MNHTVVMCRIHVVFSTKDRLPLIPSETAPRLWAYLAGIARGQQMVPLAVGGTADHVHLLLDLPAALSVAKALQLLKCNSCNWARREARMQVGFAWQEGYGAFSVSPSQTSAVVRYIEHQAEHHRGRDFAEEWAELLQKWQLTMSSDQVQT